MSMKSDGAKMGLRLPRLAVLPSFSDGFSAAQDGF
jgi:hypothetical protein